MTTRAVHLEVCHDLSSDATLKALRRIFARRCIPSQIRSDKETIFTAAENNFFGYHQISWKFNPTYAPHFGGVWKRLIRSAKNSLYTIIGTKDDTFNTLLCEIEQFMNARPITTVSSSPCDIEALTPNNFLLG